jgi:hypothetical protein
MLLSSGRRPHGDFQSWFKKPLGITEGATTQPFSKTAAAWGLNLDIDSCSAGSASTSIFRANDIDGELLGR